MINLIREYGTHYIKKAQFGAELIFEKRYTSSSKSSQVESKRKKCSEWEAEGCIGGGGIVEGITGSGKACEGASAKKCSATGFDSSWGSDNSLEATKTHTIGSSPKNFVHWGEEDNFRPVPIRQVYEIF